VSRSPALADLPAILAACLVAYGIMHTIAMTNRVLSDGERAERIAAAGALAGALSFGVALLLDQAAGRTLGVIGIMAFALLLGSLVALARKVELRAPALRAAGMIAGGTLILKLATGIARGAG
jgi:hypothetical protein